MSKKQSLTQKEKAVIVSIARTLTLVPAHVLVITLLGLLDRVLYKNTEAGESITGEEQVRVAKELLKLLRDAMQDENGADIPTPESAEEASRIATDAIQKAIAQAKSERRAKGLGQSAMPAASKGPKLEVPPGTEGFIMPGSDTVN